MIRRLRLIVAALLVFSISGQGSQAPAVQEITILHLNDLHARLTPDGGRGGFAHVVTLLNRERAGATNSLTLFGGDLVQGTPVSTLFQGTPIFEIANLLKFDVACLGNHEFDYGWEKVREFTSTGKFPNLSANVVDVAGKRLVEPPFVVVRAGPVRVAVIGAMMEDLLSTTTLERLGPWHSAPLVETLAPIVREAKQQSDIVIVLGHLTERDIRVILEGFPDVAVVVAGHDHAGLPEIDIDGRIGVNAPAYGRAVGRLDLRYDTANRRIVSHDWKLIPVDTAKYPADPETQKLVDQWEAKVSAAVDIPIGRSNRRLTGGELVALLEQMLVESTGADFGYQNAGGVRDVIPEGQLLARHVWNLMPFDDEVVVLDIPGRDLRDLIRSGSLRPARAPDPALLDPQRVYRVATEDFIAQSLADRGRKFREAHHGKLARDVYIEGIRRRAVLP